MPGDIAAPAPTLVMPKILCTAFSESREYAQLKNEYHDGTPEVGQLAQTSRRTFKLTGRLEATQLSAFWTFFTSVAGGLIPFIFYNLYEGSPVGSNYDSTGANQTGRIIVAFRGNWTQSTGLARTNLSELQLVELATGSGSGGSTSLVGGSANFGSNTALYVQGDWSAGLWIYLPSNAHGALIGMGNAGASFNASGGGPYPYLLTVEGGPTAFSIEYVHDYSDSTGLGHEYLSFAANIVPNTWTYVGVSRSIAAKTVTLYTSDGNTITTVGTQSFAHDPAFYDNGGSVSPSGAALTLGELNYASMSGTPANSLFYPVVNEIASAYMWNVNLTSAQHLSAAQGSLPTSGLIFDVANAGATPPVSSAAVTGNITATLSGTTVVTGPSGPSTARYF